MPRHRNRKNSGKHDHIDEDQRPGAFAVEGIDGDSNNTTGDINGQLRIPNSNGHENTQHQPEENQTRQQQDMSARVQDLERQVQELNQQPTVQASLMETPPAVTATLLH